MSRNLRNLLAVLAVAIFVLSCSGVDGGDDSGVTGDPVDGPGAEVSYDSGYFRKSVALEFTSVWCSNCYMLADAIAALQDEYAGRVIPVAFHLDYNGSADPMALAVNPRFYEMVNTGNGLPMFALDFRKSSIHIVNEYNKMETELNTWQKEYPAKCGVSISTEYDGQTRRLDVTARFCSDVSAPYRYHIMLVEDGIESFQIGVDEDTYIHDNVFRAMAGDNILGTKIDGGKDLVAGTEYVVNKSFSLDAGWNPDRLRVVVAMLGSRDEGDTWCCNNANECAVGSDVDYLYVKTEE